MKHHILVYLASPPANDPRKRQAWLSLLGASLHNSNLPDGGKSKIGEAVWLLDRENDVQILAQIVSQAVEFGFEYKVLFLSSD